MASDRNAKASSDTVQPAAPGATYSRARAYGARLESRPGGLAKPVPVKNWIEA